MRRALAFVLLLASGCDRRREPPGPPLEAPATSAVIAIDPPAGPGALAPNLHASASGVLASWLEPSGGGHRLRVARWRDGAWFQPATVTEGARIVANWADVPAVAEAGDGLLIATWAESSGGAAHAYDAVAARSQDGGASWTRLGLLHDDGTATEHGFVSLVGEPAAVRIFWLDGRETGRDGGAMTLRSAAVGETIGSSTVVDARVCDCCGTAAAMLPDGPLVVYRDRTDDEIRDIRIARLGAGDVPVHTDGWQIRGCPVNGPAVAARDGRVAVAWYTYAQSMHRVRAAFSEDGGRSFGPPVEVDAPRDGRSPVGRVSIALDDDGSAIVGWLASAREDASILLRRVGPDGGVGAEVRVASSRAGRDAGFPRLVRTANDLVVAWTAPGEASALRVARLPLAALPPTAPAPPTAATPPVVTPGAPAPDTAFTTLAGDEATLASLRGRVLLVNLWATWCEPCRHELPELATLHERDGGRGLVVLGLNVDRARDRDAVAAYVTRRKLPFPIWLDPHDRAAAAFGATTYPVNVLIDRDGAIRWRRDGAVTADDPELRAALDAAIGR